MILFLDFDGVLHPDAVYLRGTRRIELRAAGELFMWAPQLIEALATHHDIRIVLSTSWVRNLGYQKARKVLPAELGGRVIGATWHSAMNQGWPDYIPWDHQTRYEQIAAWLARRLEHSPWLAIDDDAEGWPDCLHKHLVLTDPRCGLSAPEALADLISKLQLHG
ncbi:HAD domain-containing protein [Pseudomonas sp. B1-22]|uniref:HAD domain-containing protein n=1 Tax=Pseudomonas sp. B1-22 TaxID=3141456 RepID=UPI003D2E5014